MAEEQSNGEEQKGDEYNAQDCISDIIDFIEEGRAFVFLCTSRDGSWSVRSNVGEISELEPFCTSILEAAKKEEEDGEQQESGGTGVD